MSSPDFSWKNLLVYSLQCAIHIAEYVLEKVKYTLMQIWKSIYIFVLPESFGFLIL